VTDIINAGFAPAPPWLTGNLQTVADRIRPRHHDLAAVSTEQRLLVAMTDGSGDALAVRIHRPRIGPRPDRPMVLVVHGLGGSIDSTYVRATTLGLVRAGYAVARVDLRGVGDSSEHCRMLYHGGRSDDLRSVLRALADEPGADGVAVVGFSLGGNVTLKLLGEPFGGLPVRGGVAVSSPIDLSVGNEHLSRRMFGLYEKFLVSKLKSDSAHSGLALTDAERAAIAKVSTLTEFDDLITAKHNGWRDAAEYYVVNSSAQFLPRITVPTLVVHALDDPMIPAGPYHAIDWAKLESETPVRRAITRTGGHVGFHEHGVELPWYVAQTVAFLDAV
jgi:predicted alpha/beta-fold hydrolase